MFVANESPSEAVRKELLKRQESAQRQYFAAVKLLAQVRKLLQPSTRAKSTKVVDPLPGQFTEAARAQESHDPRLCVSRINEAIQDPLVQLEQEVKSHAASAVLDFPRMSKEREAEALRNGVGSGRPSAATHVHLTPTWRKHCERLEKRGGLPVELSE
jgi:hypothetical protein